MLVFVRVMMTRNGEIARTQRRRGKVTISAVVDGRWQVSDRETGKKQAEANKKEGRRTWMEKVTKVMVTRNSGCTVGHKKERMQEKCRSSLEWLSQKLGCGMESWWLLDQQSEDKKACLVVERREVDPSFKPEL